MKTNWKRHGSPCFPLIINNNNKTKNGKVIVEQRENIGGSFGAYFDMFEKYSSEYDYFDH